MKDTQYSNHKRSLKFNTNKLFKQNLKKKINPLFFKICETKSSMGRVWSIKINHESGIK